MCQTPNYAGGTAVNKSKFLSSQNAHSRKDQNLLMKVTRVSLIKPPRISLNNYIQNKQNILFKTWTPVYKYLPNGLPKVFLLFF